MTQPRKKRKGTGTSSTKLKKVGHDTQTQIGNAELERSTTTNPAKSASQDGATLPPAVSEKPAQHVAAPASQLSSLGPSAKPATPNPTGSDDSRDCEDPVGATEHPVGATEKPVPLRSNSPPPSHVVWARSSIPAPASARSGSQPHLAPPSQRPSVPAPSQPPPAIRPGFRKMVPPAPPHRSNTPPPVATTETGSFEQRPAPTGSQLDPSQPSVAPTRLDTRDNARPSAAPEKSNVPARNIGLNAPHLASKMPGPGLPPPSARMASNPARTGASSATPPSVRPASVSKQEGSLSAPPPSVRPASALRQGGSPSAAPPSVRPTSGNVARPLAPQRPVAPRPPSPRAGSTVTAQTGSAATEQLSSSVHKPRSAPRGSSVHKSLASSPSSSAPTPPSSQHAEAPAASSSLPVEVTGTPSTRPGARTGALPPRPSTARSAASDGIGAVPQESANPSHSNAPSAPSPLHKPPARMQGLPSNTDFPAEEQKPAVSESTPPLAAKPLGGGLRRAIPVPPRSIGAAKPLEPVAEALESASAELVPNDAEPGELVASTVGSALKNAAAAHVAPTSELLHNIETSSALPAAPAELLAIVDSNLDSPEETDCDPLPGTAAAVAIPQPVGNSSSVQQQLLMSFAKRRARLIIAVGVVVLASIVAFALRSGSRAPSGSIAPTDKAAPIETAVPSPSNADKMVADKPVATPVVASVAPHATAAVDPVASEAAPADDEVTIQVVGKPEGAQFLYKGKVIGRTPFLLKQPRNEKRTYEVIKHGYSPRRMVVRGTEKIVGFELQLIGPYPDSL
jgi:hypothetical protein